VLEAFLTFVKGFPSWLFTVVEVLVVAVLFSAAVLFLFGFFTAIKVVGNKSVKIKEISFVPPRVIFYEEEDIEVGDK
jgi:hypothetical protein